MNHAAVLQDIDEKRVISLFEAERGVMASILNAISRQLSVDAEPIESMFGNGISVRQIEPTVRAEFMSMLSKHSPEHDIDRDALRDTAEEMESRLHMGQWSQAVVDEYESECDDIIAKAQDLSERQTV